MALNLIRANIRSCPSELDARELISEFPSPRKKKYYLFLLIKMGLQ